MTTKDSKATEPMADSRHWFDVPDWFGETPPKREPHEHASMEPEAKKTAKGK